jgi:hypothetical protein
MLACYQMPTKQKKGRLKGLYVPVANQTLFFTSSNFV